MMVHFLWRALFPMMVCMIVLPGCHKDSGTPSGPKSPACNLDVQSLLFGSVTVGESSDLTFTIKNTGGGALSGTVSETCDEFSIEGTAAYSLSAGDSATFTVRFSPTSVGSKACTVETGAAECADVSCSGTGETNQDPVIVSISAVPAEVTTYDSCTVACSAYDPDGDPLAFWWDGGFCPDTSDLPDCWHVCFRGKRDDSVAVWRAPGDSWGTLHSLHVTITDGKGGEAIDTVRVRVNPIDDDAFEFAELAGLRNEQWSVGGEQRFTCLKAVIDIEDVGWECLPNWPGLGGPSVTGSVSVSDPYVTTLHDCTWWGDADQDTTPFWGCDGDTAWIIARGLGSGVDSFVVAASPDCPHGHEVEFIVKFWTVWVNSGFSAIDTFYLRVE
jgi:hypothetical protein